MFAALGASMAPVPATCQMAYGSFLAKGCPMPCCKTKLPMPNCPMLKGSAPHDLIAGSVPSLENTLQPLHHVGILLMPQVRPVAGFIPNLIEAVQRLFSGPPPSVRAPPADVQLLDA